MEEVELAITIKEDNGEATAVTMVGTIKAITINYTEVEKRVMTTVPGTKILIRSYKHL